MDHYAVLGVAVGADAETIKRAYQRLALQHHPDKIVHGQGDVEVFQRIQAAYDVLKDPHTRTIYDNTLKNGLMRVEHPQNGDVDLDDMEYSEDQQAYTYPCRCGGVYVVTEQQLESGCDVAPCSMCSLAVRVLYGVDDS
eukprot:comp16224_c0_seq1/m.13918 comp16224_c0_seq1/g.13918  ORF comp16224_c0_seq1/g.13918 comp16224_c0_seq1/m.13918 type:complete len:139 (-) comp16224_c0_seq1:618-1034(-)